MCFFSTCKLTCPWKSGPIRQVAYGTRPQEVVSTLKEVKCSSSNLGGIRGLKPLQPGYVDQTQHQNVDVDEKLRPLSMSNQTSCHKMSEKHHWTWQKLLNTRGPLSLSLCGVAGNGTPVFEVGTPWRYKDFRHPGPQKLLHILLETRIPKTCGLFC